MARVIRTFFALLGMCMCLVRYTRADVISEEKPASIMTVGVFHRCVVNDASSRFLFHPHRPLQIHHICASSLDIFTLRSLIDVSRLRDYTLILVWTQEDHNQMSSLLQFLDVSVPVLEITDLYKISICQTGTNISLCDGNCKDDSISDFSSYSDKDDSGSSNSTSDSGCDNMYFCNSAQGNNTLCDWIQEVNGEYLAHSHMILTHDVIRCIVIKFKYKRIFQIIEGDSSNEWIVEQLASLHEEDERNEYRILRVHLRNDSNVTILTDVIEKSLQHNIDVIPVFVLSSHSMLLLLDVVESYAHEEPHTFIYWLQTTRFFVLTDNEDILMSALRNHPFIPWNMATIDITYSVTRSQELLETMWRGADTCNIQSHLLLGDNPSFLPITRADTEDAIFPMTKYGLNQRQLVVLTKAYPPYVIRNVVNGSIQFEGIAINMLETLSNLLNFTYILREPSDGNWGTNTGGYWTGIVGQLARKEADLTTLLSVQAERNEVIDFAFPYAFLQSNVWLRRRPALTGVRVFSVMDYVTVILLMTSLAVSTVTLIVIDVVMGNYRSLRNRRRLLSLLSDVAFSQFGSILSQPMQQSHFWMSARTLVSLWWMFRLILAVTFTGVLIANLAISKSTMPFTTLEELVQQDGYRWGTLGNAFLQTAIQNSNVTIFQRIWKGMEAASLVDPTVLSGDLKGHLNKVATERYAYLGTVPSWEAHGYDSCDFVKLREEFLANRFAFALQKDSPFTARFSLASIRMEESGYMTIKRKQWLAESTSSGVCGTRDVNPTKPISLDDVTDVFIALGAGLCLALTVIIIELLLHNLLIRRIYSRAAIRA